MWSQSLSSIIIHNILSTFGLLCPTPVRILHGLGQFLSSVLICRWPRSQPSLIIAQNLYIFRNVSLNYLCSDNYIVCCFRVLFYFVFWAYYLICWYEFWNLKHFITPKYDFCKTACYKYACVYVCGRMFLCMEGFFLICRMYYKPIWQKKKKKTFWIEHCSRKCLLT